MTRAEVARLVSRIRVVDSEGGNVGATSSGAKMSRSESGRAAANARWHGKPAR